MIQGKNMKHSIGRLKTPWRWAVPVAALGAVALAGCGGGNGGLAGGNGGGTSVGQVIPVQYGELRVAYTSTYGFVYNDKGSGAVMDGAFWRPLTNLEGFRPLGSVVVSGYANLNGARSTIVVSDGGQVGDGRPAAVVSPTGYARVWDDSGSSANRDGSVWRPIAPEGYLALGDVATGTRSPPSLDAIWCVRADLVTSAAYGSMVWRDKGSGGRHDISTWEVIGDGVTVANTFRASNNQTSPPSIVLASVLRIPAPA